MRGMIQKVEAIPVKLKSTNWDQSTLVVKITDENGLVGIGECDGPPEVIRAFFEMETAHGWSQNPAEILIGRDPLDRQAIWDDLYEGFLWQGRRGLALFVISGIDMALYDLAGKQLGVPAYKLLGGAVREKTVPYMTLYPAVSGSGTMKELLQGYEELFEKAKRIGAQAVKMSILTDKSVSDDELVGFIQDGRKLLGYDTELMVDFLYRWRDPYAAKRALRKLEDVDLYFAEAILPHDDIKSHALVARNTDIRICGAEMATSRFEIKDWVENGGVAIVQPDLNRCGGLTEIRRIADYCELHGVEVMPHGWKTGITAAAGQHFHAAVRNAKYFEYLHPSLYESALREHLVKPEAEVVNGEIALPDRPGLGIELNEDFIRGLK